MEYRLRQSSCSDCYRGYVAINEWGYCAKCWLKLGTKNQSAISGEPVRVVTQTVHYPRPGFWRSMLFASVAGVIGGTAGRFVLATYILPLLH